MTWEELCEKAEKLGYVSNGTYLEKNLLRFYEQGKFMLGSMDEEAEIGWITVSRWRSFDNMYQIMKALED